MKSVVRALAIVGVLGLVGSQMGCKGLAEKLAKRGDAGAAAFGGGDDDTGSGSSADDKANQLLNGLVDCVNGLDRSLSDSLRQYYGDLPYDKKTGKALPPPSSDKNPSGPREINATQLSKCEKVLTAAASSDKYKGIAEKYKAVTSKLVPELNAAHKYYDHKDYQDDKYAKAKTFFAAIDPLVEEFRKSSTELREIVSKENDARFEQEMKDIEKEMGRNLIFQKLNVMKFAKSANAIGADEDATAADLETVVTAFETAVNEMNTYAESHKDEVGKAMMWSMLDSAAEDYLKGLKARLRRVRDKTPYGTGEKMLIRNGNGQMVDGHPDKVADLYNKLVDRSNSVNFR